jgi:HlyD family secretion protein
MKRTTVFVVAAIGALAAINYGLLAARHDVNPAPVSPSETRSAVVAGPGRVEALSEEVRVSAQVSGRLQAVLVDETDAVSAGQILAIVENADYRARVASAEASLELRRAEARRVHNGARDQERRDAAAAVREAEAVLDSAHDDVRRKRDLFRETVISRAELDKAEELIRVSQARVDSVRERLSLLEAGSREEDIARADADVALATAALAEARAILEKTYVRAPITGTVLRRDRRGGESVSTQFDSPIVTIADRSRVRVRVDVDETDVARVKVGQPAYVTADAFAGRRFAGRVVRVGQLLGKKTVRTDEPGERVDTKILETLLELDGGSNAPGGQGSGELPLGLRVQAFIGNYK